MSELPSRAMGAGGDKVHLSGYQSRDIEVVDYRMYESPGTGLSFRGPEPVIDGTKPAVAFVGAAQTLGCFCEDPFPGILGRELGVEAMNFGYGGAGPEFFCGQEKLIEQLNKAELVVLQAMSGRSQSNSVFDSGGLEYLTRRSDGKKMGANEGYQEILSGPSVLKGLGPVGRKIAKFAGIRGARKIMEETRRGWVRSNLELLSAIERPVVFLWFSKRNPAYEVDFRSVKRMFGEFPQMVTEEMVRKVAGQCAEYVECVSDRGSQQPLISRFTGQPTCVDPANDRPDLGGSPAWTHNAYYPSPEMHEDAAELLAPVIRKFLG